MKITTFLQSFFLQRTILFLPEQLIQCFPQYMTNGKAEADGGVVVPFFYGIDGLSADAY